MQLMRRILDAQFQKSHLRKIVSNSKSLNNDKQSMLYNALTKNEFIFDRTLGTWKIKPVHIELHPGKKPYYDKPYPVPWSHEEVFCKAVDNLREPGVWKNVNRLDLRAPTFIQPKRNRTLILLSDFRKN